MVAPILHLRTLNPHVASVLDSNGVYQRIAGPRSAAPLPKESLAASALGVSAFAFQGTNAHVIVEGSNGWSGPSSQLQPAASFPWNKRHVWVHPEPLPLITRILMCSPSAATFHLELKADAHASMWDHLVSGRALVPGTAFMEMASQCVMTVSSASAAASGKQLVAALRNVSISSPCILPARQVGDSKAGGQDSHPNAKSGAGAADQRRAISLICTVESIRKRVMMQSVAPGASAHVAKHAEADLLLLAFSDDTVMRGDGQSRYPRFLRELIQNQLRKNGAYSSSQPMASAVAEVPAVGSSPTPQELDAVLQLGALARCASVYECYLLMSLVVVSKS